MKNDQSLTDRGWQQMAMLLDRDLPQGRKRHRRGAWWLFATGIALILTGWGYHFLYSQESSSPTPVQQELQTPVAQETQDLTPPSQDMSSPQNTHVPVQEKDDLRGETPSQVTTAAQKKLNENPIAASTPTTQNHAAGESLTSRAKSMKSTSDSPVKKTPGNDINNVVNNVVNNVSDTVHPSDITLQDASAKRAGSDGTEIQHETTTGDAAIVTTQTSAGNDEVTGSEALVQHEASSDNTQAIPALRTLYEIEPLENRVSGIASTAGAVSIVTAPKSNRNRFSVEVMTALHGNVEGIVPYGIEGGIVGSFSPARKVKISTGVSYGYYSRDAVLGFSSALDEESTPIIQDPGTYVPVYDVEDVLSNNLEFSEANQLTQEFGYVHVPLKVEYRALPRLAVSVGARFSKLVFAPGRYRLDDARFGFNGSIDNLSASRKYLYDYGIVNKFDVAPTIGVTWLAATRLSIELSYMHGLIHYINNKSDLLDVTNRTDLHRTLSLGVRYRVL